MPLLASVTDLQDSVSVDAGKASRALRAATDVIVSDLGWPVFRHTAALTFTSTPRLLYLPARNVTTVTVTVAGVVLDPAAYTVDAAKGSVVFLGPVGAATVTYTAGWLEVDIPSPLSSACLDEAVRRVDNRGGRLLRSWTVGAEAESYMGDDRDPLDSDRRLDAYRLPGGVA